MNTLMKRNDDNGNSSATSFSSLVDKIFRENVNRFFDDGFAGHPLGRMANVPVNVKETDKSYEMEVVAPGLKKEDLKIDVNGDTLTVSFEHREESKQEDKKEGWLRQEYRMRSFSRSFTLDDTIDASKIAATYNDGILRLILSKKEGAQKISRTIEIK